MACIIRLKRMGAKKKAHFKIVVCDKRVPLTSKSIEEIGIYDPVKNPALFKVDRQRYDYWVKCGAKPTETVRSLVKKQK